MKPAIKIQTFGAGDLAMMKNTQEREVSMSFTAFRKSLTASSTRGSWAWNLLGKEVEVSKSDAKEDLIDAMDMLGTDGLNEVLGEILSHISQSRNTKSGQHLYGGVKVPNRKDRRKQMAKSLTEAIQDWAGF